MKYSIKVGKDTYPINQDEVPKVIKAMDEKKIVLLKSGVFNGFNISAIIRDIHSERGWNYNYSPTAEDKLSRKDYIVDFSPLNILGDEKKLLE